MAELLRRQFVKSRPSRTAFTLIELLVVTAVIMVLVSIVIFSVQGTYAYAMRLKCQHRMEQVWYACNMYHNENRGKLPQAWDFEARLPWYVNLYDEGYLDRDDAVGCPMAESDPIVPSDEAEGSGGPGVAPEEQIELAYMGLKWLRDNTVWCEENWQWDGDECYWEEQEDANANPSITAFALLAYIRLGFHPEVPDEYGFHTVLRGGLDYLMTRVSDTGVFNTGCHKRIQNAIIAMALIEAYKEFGDLAFIYKPTGSARSLKNAAQGAFTYQENLYAGESHHFWHNEMYWGFWGGWPGYGPSMPHAQYATEAWAIATAADDFDLGNTPAYMDEWLDDTVAANGDGTVQHTYTASGRADNFSAAALARRIERRPADPAVASALAWLKNGEGIDDRYLHMARFAVDEEGNPVSGLVAGGRPDQANLVYTYYMSQALVQLGGEDWAKWCAASFHEDYGIPGHAEADGEGAYWPTWMHGPTSCWKYAHAGPPYATALACMAMEIMINTPGGGGTTVDYRVDPYSFGYNRLLGLDRRTPAADTIVLIDYLLWGIRPEVPESRIAPRHAGRVNALFADGRVKALYPGDIKDGMWTPEGGD